MKNIQLNSLIPSVLTKNDIGVLYWVYVFYNY